MGVLSWVVDKIAFPSPPASYSLTSHPELFFVKSSRKRPASYPGVPCMLYAIPQGAPLLLVHAHSNGCDIGDMRQTLHAIADSLRVHVMSFEYPGYGLHVGAPGMHSIDEAARAVLDFIIDDLQVNPGQIVWYGRSIGSGPCLRSAQRMTKELGQKPAGLVLQCGFASFPEVAGHIFGKVAKKLVPRMWDNLSMIKDLACPILILHGRNDSMIPIEQSEKLWSAVVAKELSVFLPCDCGHNDFNFRQCTLRPLFSFLSGVIRAPDYPATNFIVVVGRSSHAFVYHVGPLRDRLSVLSFRRPELEAWMRRTLGLDAPADAPADGNARASASNASAASVARGASGASIASGGGAGGEESVLSLGCRIQVRGLPGQPDIDGLQGHLLEFDSPANAWKVLLDGRGGPAVHVREENLVRAMPARSAASGTDFSAPAQGANDDGTKSAASVPPPAAREVRKKGKKGKKGEKADELPPIPDLALAPPVDDVLEALTTAAGLMRLCAPRLHAFLGGVQRLLDGLEDLEQRPMEDIVSLVDAEYWACDPLITVWEEVDLPRGDRVAIRAGPFVIDNRGERSFEPNFSAAAAEAPLGVAAGGAAEVDRLRVPLWAFCPTAQHLRCFAEWSVLNSERLHLSLDPVSGGCCCGPTSAMRRGHSSRRSSRSILPLQGALATSYAALFANWTKDKTDEADGLLARFAELYRAPEEALNPDNLRGGSLSASLRLSAVELFTRSANLPGAPGDTTEAFGTDYLGGFAGDGGLEARATSRSLLNDLGPGPPWAPAAFSAAARSYLREAAGLPSPALKSFYDRLWSPSADAGGTLPSIGDLPPMPDLVAKVSSSADVDWLAAVLLRHRQRERAASASSPGGCRSSSDAGGTSSIVSGLDAGASSAEPGMNIGATEAERLLLGTATSEAMKAFAVSRCRSKPRLCGPRPAAPQRPRQSPETGQSLVARPSLPPPRRPSERPGDDSPRTSIVPSLG